MVTARLHLPVPLEVECRAGSATTLAFLVDDDECALTIGDVVGISISPDPAYAHERRATVTRIHAVSVLRQRRIIVALSTPVPELDDLLEDVARDDASVSGVWLKLRVEHARGAFESLACQTGPNDVEIIAPGGSRALADGDLAFVMIASGGGKASAARVVTSERCANGDRRVKLHVATTVRSLLAA